MEREGKFVTVDQLKRQRNDLQAQAKRLTDAIAYGGNMPSLMAKLERSKSRRNAWPTPSQRTGTQTSKSQPNECANTPSKS